MVILSCFTNIIADTLGEVASEAALSQLMMELFEDSKCEGLFRVFSSYKDIRFFISLPNLRNKPMWYAAFRPTIVRHFIEMIRRAPDNVRLIDDLPCELDPDDVHFTILGGITYIKHLIDESTRLFSEPQQTREQVTSVDHGARIVGLEHRMGEVESHVRFLDARMSEEADNCANERDLCRFIITGKIVSLIFYF